MCHNRTSIRVLLKMVYTFTRQSFFYSCRSFPTIDIDSGYLDHKQAMLFSVEKCHLKASLGVGLGIRNHME